MSSHLAEVHFSLSCYLWCLSDVCVSPFCWTTVGLLPSLSSWESDLCVYELCVRWVCEGCVRVYV